MTNEVKLGALCWNQYTDWPSLREAGVRADRLGFESIWTWDHVYPIVGSHEGPIIEGWLTLAAWAEATERATIGLMVGANTFRNPALVGKMVTQLDQMTGGRMYCGIGAAWNDEEHHDFGLEFGASPGERLRWLEEAVVILRGMFDGTEPSGTSRYATSSVRNDPAPVQAHVPILVGGGGERKTLRIVAQYADIWNVFGTPETLARKDAILRAHCADVGRDPATIERSVGCKITIRRTEAEAVRARNAILEHNRTPLESVRDDVTFWTGTPEQIAATIGEYRAVGFHTFLVETPAPYDAETMELLIDEVKPMVEAAPANV
jgi:alkanesulfonate monooxygenase SsuD/methylene tetrahydromethanopterin reductase-like flavin-dependent oxidoreductase (luciferase family)